MMEPIIILIAMLILLGITIAAAQFARKHWGTGTEQLIKEQNSKIKRK